jgi:hypothetical protein
MHISAAPEATFQEVDFDSTFIPPAGEWLFTHYYYPGYGGGSFRPDYIDNNPIIVVDSFPQYDVEVHLNGGADVAYVGQTNIVEIWIQNEESLGAVSMAFEISCGVSYSFDPAYGELAGMPGYLNAEGDAVSAFVPLHFEYHLMNDVSPDSISVEGSSLTPPYDLLPGHSEPHLCYTMAFDIPEGQPEMSDGFCIDNVSWQNPFRNWQFWIYGIANVAPYFQGWSNHSSTDPDAPAVCFDIVAGFLCGDADADGLANITDAVYLIAYIFSDGPPPMPLAAGDADCDGIANITDAVYLIAYIFSDGPAPCDPNGDEVPDC